VDLSGDLGRLTVECEVADALGERLGLGGVGDVVDVHAADAAVAADLVVADEHVTVEGRSGQVHRLDAFTRGTAGRGGDEADFLGLAGLADVDHVHAGVVAADAAPGCEVGIALVDADVGDLPLDDVAQLELADQADVRLGGRQMASTAAVLVVAVCGRRVVDGAVGCRDGVMCLG
jgi:hypothetical protein